MFKNFMHCFLTRVVFHFHFFYLSGHSNVRIDITPPIIGLVNDAASPTAPDIDYMEV